LRVDIRKIEKAWRYAWMRAIASGLRGPRTTKLPDRPLKVLFLRYERIGDMIMSTGVIRVLSRVAAGGTVDVVGNSLTLPVLENNPHVGKAFALDRKSWKSYARLATRLRREKYDVIVDGRINNPPIFTSTPLLMLAASVPYRVGVSGGNNDRVYNVRVKPFDRRGLTHYIESSKSLIEPFALVADDYDWRPEIVLSDEERSTAEAVWIRASRRLEQPEETRFLANLSASEKKRRWPDERFIESLSELRRQYPRMPITVMALPAESDRARTVAAAITAEYAPTPNLRDALALVGSSHLVFTPDTSISHAASAFDKPAVILLKSDCLPYAPWQTKGELVLWEGETIDSLTTSAVTGPLLRLRGEFGSYRSGTAKTS
jgi:ADP-heptose:LPS heptosyltransferase